MVRRARHGLVHLCCKEHWLQPLSSTCHSGPLVVFPDFRVTFPSQPSGHWLKARQCVMKCTEMSSLSLCSVDILTCGLGELQGFPGQLLPFPPTACKANHGGEQLCHVPVPGSIPGHVGSCRTGRGCVGSQLARKSCNFPCSLPGWSSSKRADGFK